MNSFPPINNWPWLNLECRGCKWANVKVEKDSEGQIWHEARCDEPNIIAWLSDVGLGSGENSTVILDRPCKKYIKKRAYHARGQRKTWINR